MSVHRRLPGLLAALALVGAAGGTARAEDPYPRVSLTVRPIYLIIPMLVLDAELAVHPRWSVAVRGGVGRLEVLDEKLWISEVGGQAIHYLFGNAGRGMQLGVDARAVGHEGNGLLTGLGDGVAAGPFVGYKRVYGSGVTLGAQLGAQVVVTGESEDPVLPYLNLALGVSFLPVGERPQGPPGETPVWTNPLDHHRGPLFGASIGMGIATVGGCGSCELEPGIAVESSLGWFLHRRVALVIDSNVMVALFSLSSGFGSFGFGLTALAVQAWPHPDFWLKVGVGVAQMSSVGLGGTGNDLEVGGGGTLAAGYEFHHAGNFAMDLQLRATHGSFEDPDFDGIDSFIGTVGVRWY